MTSLRTTLAICKVVLTLSSADRLLIPMKLEDSHTTRSRNHPHSTKRCHLRILQVVTPAALYLAPEENTQKKSKGEAHLNRRANSGYHGLLRKAATKEKVSSTSAIGSQAIPERSGTSSPLPRRQALPCIPTAMHFRPLRMHFESFIAAWNAIFAFVEAGYAFVGV